MYSDKKNVIQLVALLKAHGITTVVVSPGTRNIPIVESLGQDPDFTCYSVVDERSAAFFGLGLIQRLHRPVAICCTSGTAVMNYGSAVAEAFYQKLPLLLITADRSPRRLGQYEPQMIPQPGIFEKIVKKHVSLPEVETEEDEWYCNRLINEALLALEHQGRGPVHINIVLYGTITRFTVPYLPKVRKISRSYTHCAKDVWDGYARRLLSYDKILIVYGQNLPPPSEEVAALDFFIQKYGCAVVGDSLSNMRHRKGLWMASGLLDLTSDERKKDLVPELVITVHGHVLPPLEKFLKGGAVVEHWHVAEDGAVVDQFKCLTEVIQGPVFAFFQQMAEVSSEDGGRTSDTIYSDSWLRLRQEVSESELPFCDLYAVREVFKSIPSNASLHLGNSSCVRHAQLFPLNDGVRVYCNRGTHGIDGCMSTAVGYAAASDTLTYLLIGDLSFFYDLNALWNRHVSSKLRVILTNNGGAGIFQYNLGKKGLQTLDYNIAAEHGTSAKGWVESLGYMYLSARNKTELSRCLPELAREDVGTPIILEVFTSMKDDAEALRKLCGKDGMKGTWAKIKKRLF